MRVIIIEDIMQKGFLEFIIKPLYCSMIYYLKENPIFCHSESRFLGEESPATLVIHR